MISAGAFALLLVAAPGAAQDTPAPSTPTVTTAGEAVVRRAPDRAFLTVAVEARARNPRDAQRQNAETMTAVRKQLASAGLNQDAVRTIGYNVEQEVDFVNGKRVPRGYVASNVLEVRVDEIERTGEVLDLAVQAGATSVSTVRFDLKDRRAAEQEALRLAVEDARARADAAAAGIGRSIDRVLRIEESRVPSAPPRPLMASMARAAEADVSTPIDPGTIEIRADVVVTAAIK